MEEILGQKMDTPISLSGFLKEYKELLSQSVLSAPPTSCRLSKAADICSLIHLENENDVRVAKFIPAVSENHRHNLLHLPDKAIQLKTLSKLRKRKQAIAGSPFQRSEFSHSFVKIPEPQPNEAPCEYYNELIVTVRLYRPARATHIGQTLEKPVFAQEFECLGSNFLSEMRDCISCICNKKRFFDISEHPSYGQPDKTTDPGYFFITDTFYNDTRNPNNADYSATIIEWAKKAEGLKHLKFKVASMEHTRFIDLNVSLGFPQLYQHHGNCEHVFVISQVELLTPGSECQYPSQFPRVRMFSIYNKKPCVTCGNQMVGFIVEKSNRQLHDPAYLCKKCFYSYHYIDGKKIGEFKAYRIDEVEVHECTTVEQEGDIDECITVALENESVSDREEDEAKLELIEKLEIDDHRNVMFE